MMKRSYRGYSVQRERIPATRMMDNKYSAKDHPTLWGQTTADEAIERYEKSGMRGKYPILYRMQMPDKSIRWMVTIPFAEVFTRSEERGG